MKDFIRILLRFVPPYKSQLILSVVFNILSTILSLFAFAMIIPILEILFKINEEIYHYIAWSGMANVKEWVVNNFYWYVSHLVETHGGGTALLLLGLFLVAMTFFKVITAFFALFFMIPIRTGVVRDIRSQIYNRVLALPIGFFTEERKGDIIARMTGDVAEVENSIMSSLDMMFKNPIMVTVYLITMFVLSWQLTLFVLVLLPVAGYIMGAVGKKLKQTSMIAQTQWGVLLSCIEETLGGLRIIKAFLAEKKMQQRFADQNDAFRRTSNRIHRRYNLAHPMSEFLGTITIVLVLWYGGTLILKNESAINAATFIYYIVIFYSIINPAKDFTRAFYAVQKGLASMERIDVVLKAENPIKDGMEKIDLPHIEQQISFENVSFRYQTEWVLKHINLSIPKGSSVALVGQSGSGKSTMLDLIPRFYDVEEGSIRIDGTDIRSVKVSSLRRLIGNVNQDPILFNDSFYNNIAFGLDTTTLEDVMAAARIANAHDFIMATEQGYDSNIGDRGCKLSGGQRQRISIARAILKNPPILILDEATSALDTESERLVQDAIEKLMKNRTTIVVAHRLSTIRNASLICVLHEGEIVERGVHDELLRLNGYYKRLVDMQEI